MEKVETYTFSVYGPHTLIEELEGGKFGAKVCRHWSQMQVTVNVPAENAGAFQDWCEKNELECSGYYSYQETPDAVIRDATLRQCPDGYPMKLVSQDDWTALSEAWNQGIDAHLEAITERSSANHTTGEVLVHPEELHVLLRRLNELDEEKLWPDWDLSVENYPSECLRQCILTTLNIEEI